jgi:MFS family permease
VSSKKPLDLGGIVTLTVLLTGLVVALNGLDTSAIGASLRTWPVAFGLLLVVILVPVFWRIEKRAVDPLVRPGLFNSRPVVTASLIGTGIGALQSAGSFYPALAVAAIGVSQSMAAWMLVPGVTAATLSSFIAGRLNNRVSTRLIITVSLSMVVISVLAFALAKITIPTFILASILGSTGLGGVLGAPLRLVILDNSLPGERGAAQGLLSNFTSTGRLIGAAFVGSIASSAGGGAAGYQAAFLGMSLVAAGMLALGATLRSRRLLEPDNVDSPAPA